MVRIGTPDFTHLTQSTSINYKKKKKKEKFLDGKKNQSIILRNNTRIANIKSERSKNTKNKIRLDQREFKARINGRNNNNGEKAKEGRMKS